MRARTRGSRRCGGLILTIAFTAVLPETAANASERAGPARDAVLRLARSRDGRTFEDAGIVLRRGAAAPGLALLPQDRLLLVFDELDEASGPNGTRMVATLSRDGGESWAPARPIQILDSDRRRIAGRHGDAALLRRDRLRLFFELKGTSEVEPNRAAPRGGVIASAVTRDGIHYRLDPAVRLRVGRAAAVHPTVIRFEGNVQLFAGVAPWQGAPDDDGAQRVLLRYVSTDGRRFAPAGAGDVEDGALIVCALADEQKLTAYGTTAPGIEVFESRDGRRWERVGDAGLPGGFDPTVVRLADGSYLMVYCAALADDEIRAGQLIGSYRGGDGETSLHDGEGNATKTAHGAEGSTGNPEDVSKALPIEVDRQRGRDESVGATDPDAWDAILPDGDTASWDAQLDAISAAQPSMPLPNFQDNVDYVEWLSDVLLPPGPNSAGEAYAAFMPSRDDYMPDGRPWPDMPNMFDESDLARAPEPWDPMRHPDWEAGRLAGQEVLEAFRAATRMAGYRYTPHFVDLDDDGEVDDALLLQMVLPNLRSHRSLAKITLANGWRRGEDGKVPPEQMLDGWETVLRDADHMHEGMTLIEHLVGLSEENIVHRDARWALRRGLFDTEDKIDAAISTLDRFDGELVDPSPYVRGEEAMALDLVQYAYSPAGADGMPRANEEHIRKIAGFFGEDDKEALAKAREVEPAEVLATVDAMDAYYRDLVDSMRIGYPLIRGKDIDEEGERIATRNPITRAIIPALGRVHQFRTWSETERRATRLSYEVERFKMQNGRWPATLDELPIEPGSAMRTDPFTGGDFTYFVGPDGPTIYSLGENALDDGGIHNPERMAEPKDETLSDDFLFWPPQRQ